MNIVEFQDGFNLYAKDKVFWLSRKSGWTREQITQLHSILYDCTQKLEFDLETAYDIQHDLKYECDDLRDEIWSLRDKLNAVVEVTVD